MRHARPANQRRKAAERLARARFGTQGLLPLQQIALAGDGQPGERAAAGDLAGIHAPQYFRHGNRAFLRMGNLPRKSRHQYRLARRRLTRFERVKKRIHWRSLPVKVTTKLITLSQPPLAPLVAFRVFKAFFLATAAGAQVELFHILIAGKVRCNAVHHNAARFHDVAVV